ncbi:endonuclease/exonuclease/phosphatase family protein [Amycolatopsis sp. PS_44_ISF1]|uniref:endonuclease/exonuclease/phosphatase family protein n=1 Tax=Amycolatopsis sp. PS_44_ISF1 TaxID=2974917 RepID=UPI0028DE984B|nr:endonuclease/exonuclease/phosphatase family protein [Amycolatopsis sp. PS_44_ISF1]MDT8913557.1 endonuclease/exonuclease/phosphatase family protein [Amycolatopsis sp. PS_44_ISF1]
MTLGPFRVRMLVANLKRGGYDTTTRFHDHDKLEQMLSVVDQAPHIIVLSECTHYGSYHSQPLLEVVHRLGRLWGTTTDTDGRRIPSVPYMPFISTVPGSINVPGLLVDTRYVIPQHWHGLDGRKVHANTLVARINGERIRLKSVHWNGSTGPVGFDLQADQDAQLASEAAIIAGDFNATSSAAGDTMPADWEQHCRDHGQPWKLSQKGVRTATGWRINTGSYDRFLEHGWWDAGTAAGDFTPTINPAGGAAAQMRNDRIAISNRAPVTLVPGSYRVHVPDHGRIVSDHRALSCELDIPAAAG